MPAKGPETGDGWTHRMNYVWRKRSLKERSVTQTHGWSHGAARLLLRPSEDRGGEQVRWEPRRPPLPPSSSPLQVRVWVRRV